MGNYSAGNRPSDPANQCFVVTPDDDTPQNPIPKAIRASANGYIKIKAKGSALAVIHPVKAGERIDVFCEMVYATDTVGQTQIIGYA